MANKEYWDNQPLGKARDVVLAEKLGVTRETISYQRKIRGIPRAPTLLRSSEIKVLQAAMRKPRASRKWVTDNCGLTLGYARRAVDVAFEKGALVAKREGPYGWVEVTDYGRNLMARMDPDIKPRRCDVCSHYLAYGHRCTG